MQGSSDHFALRLRKWRLSVVQTVVSSYFVAFLLGLVALVLIRVDAIAALAIIILVCAACLSVGYYLNKIDMTI